MKKFHLIAITTMLGLIGYMGYEIATHSSGTEEEIADTPFEQVKENINEIAESVTEKVKENIEKVSPEEREQVEEEKDTIDILFTSVDENRLISQVEEFLAKVTIDTANEVISITPLVTNEEEKIVPVHHPVPTHAKVVDEDESSNDQQEEDFDYFITVNMDTFSNVMMPVLEDLNIPIAPRNTDVELELEESYQFPVPKPIETTSVSSEPTLPAALPNGDQLFSTVMNSISFDMIQEINESVETDLQGRDLLALFLALHRMRDTVEIEFPSSEI